jgi:DNA-binding transcriptional LysR family regulator
MNFQQLRSVREAERCGFNLTEVAATLHTSQPGVSRQVRELEEELGVELFVRSGKRLLGLTPIITYEVGYTGRSHIDDAFAQVGLQPDVVLTAMDADVIKTYVELEMGVGIVASIALDESRDRDLRTLDAGHLFQINVSRLGIRRNHWQAGFAFGFIENFAPSLTREVVLETLGEM